MGVHVICSHCGHEWEYSGKSAPGQYIGCARCNRKFIRPYRRVDRFERLNVEGRCQVCDRLAQLSIVHLEDGCVLLACDECVKERRF
ncbi:DNA-directed RNA polymerase subunit RPC12/RpoP [Methanofollis sp. W23]|uniref:hypothetical protein n=1 Tax=Methanofollis sp. W23 TaxID=2817849 RepID=UPI001AE17543|nr:hypothetical protein [Methanofollis sp. W23]MBP2147210.1 DNA-directed RNA polymerase subunit RPC12/RpoP [Methanofollis sp. W23]